MTEKERRKLHSKGIFTVTQLSYTFRPRKRSRRSANKEERHHHSLKALAIREKRIHIVSSPDLKLKGTAIYLDVEGLPDRDFYYLIGARVRCGDLVQQHSLWAENTAEEEEIWNRFLSILATVQHPVLVHYGSYERSFPEADVRTIWWSCRRLDRRSSIEIACESTVVPLLQNLSADILQ